MFAVGPTDLTIWRFVGGFAIGMASVIGPAYIAEISPPAYRGRLASLQQLAIVLGIAISAVVNYLIGLAAGGTNTQKLGGLEAWRWMLGAEVVPAVFYGVMASLIPESPRFLIASNQDDRARKVLHRRSRGPARHVADRIAEIRVRAGRRGQTAVPRPADALGPQLPADRLDRHRPVGLPTVRRHQCDLLLLLAAVAAGRLRHVELPARSR